MAETDRQPGLDATAQAPVRPPGRLREVALLFLRLGFTAFGGPAAHIAMMRHEVVERRQWIRDARFLDLLGAANIIPGPSSTEMAIYLGYEQAGWRGLILAGLLFILPAMLIVLGLAWAYVRFGALPQATWLLYGIKPVIIAIIAQALWSLGRTAFKRPLLIAAGWIVFGLYLLGGSVLLLLFGAGFAIMGLETLGRLRSRPGLPAFLPLGLPALLTSAASAAGFSLWALFVTFLTVGGTLYGSGYVLLAYLRRDLVLNLGAEG